MGNGIRRAPGARSERDAHRMLRLLRWVSAAVLAVYGAVAILPACLTPNTNGYAAYYTASRILWTDPADLYRVYDRPWFQARIDEFGFVGVRDIYNTQPPTCSLMLAALARLSPSRARVAWVLATSGMVWLAAGELLAGLGAVAKREIGRWSPVACAAATAFSPLRDNFRHGQCYTLLLLCLCLVFRLELRGTARTSFAAGVPLGLMAVLKTSGLWLWPLLLIGGRWRTIVGAVATVLVVALAAVPVIGVGAWRAYVHELPRLSTDPSRYVTAYQTVTSMMGHLFCFDPPWSRALVVNAPAVARWSTGLVMVAALGISALIQRLSAPSAWARVLSLAMIASLNVTMAPVAENYHYVLVLPSLGVAIAWAIERGGSPTTVAFLAVVVALLSTPLHYLTSPALEVGWLGLLAYPRVYGALLLWGWLCVALIRMRGGDEVGRSIFEGSSTPAPPSGAGADTGRPPKPSHSCETGRGERSTLCHP